MKLNVRTLKNVEAEIDVDLDETVLDLKKKVEVAFSHMRADEQLLIHRGTVLEDGRKLLEYPNIKEHDKLIVMIPKKKPAHKSESGNSSTQTATSTPQFSSSVEVVTDKNSVSCEKPENCGSNANLDVSQAVQQVSHAETSSNLSSSGGLTLENFTVPLDPIMVENICNMGFEKSRVECALRAAFNNADRAVEYLMTSIPSTVSISPEHAEILNSTHDGEVPENGGLASLRQHPLFDQLRAAVQANPRIISGMLHIIQYQNPELFDLIANNQMEFLRMFAEDSDAPFSIDMLGDQRNEQETIHITAEQEEVVRRISECLGFSSNVVLQALLVCDWNEDHAANLLFETAKDFEEEDEGHVSQPPT